MGRIIIFTIIYLATLISYVVFNQQQWMDTFVFGIFLVSILAYTFSREGLPNKDIQQFPEPFAYKSKRLNIYTYGMVIALGIASFLLSINMTTLKISQPVLILVLWPIIIAISYLLASLNSKREALYSAYDYICNLRSEEVDLELFNWVYQKVITGKNIEEVLGTFAKYNINFLRETYSLIFSYIFSKEIKISYEEIVAAQENREITSSK